MADKGDSFTVKLQNTHLKWGEHRNTDSRDIIVGEGYIPIPASQARRFNIYNSNHTKTGLGYNEFKATSIDGFFKGTLKSSGNSKAGDIYAKNLHGKGKLKALGNWFDHMNFIPGDKVKVTWVSSIDIILEKV